MIKAPETIRPIAVVTIHGTGDTADSLEGEKWFQSGSAFTNRLKQQLADKGIDAQVFPQLWSGANSAAAREAAASALARTVKGLTRTHGAVHIISHSHGGNVANDGACMLGWSPKRRRIASIATVGTPFFRTRVTVAERLSAWGFISVIVLSMAYYAIALGLSWQPGPDAWRPFAGHVRTIATVIFALSLALIFPLALRGVARILRADRRARADPKIFAIWHPNDEAIAFLQRLEQAQIEPFPRWSFLRRSRTGAIVWGVRAAIAATLTALAYYAYVNRAGLSAGVAEEIAGLIVSLLGISLLFAPVVFSMTYVAFRLGALFLLEAWLRGGLNRLIGGSLKGVAFGRDGDLRIGEVSHLSHYYGAIEARLDGEIAERMLAASADAAKRLFDKYRSGLFNVGVDTSNALNELTADAMTWDSLIHTTYFDQPEIAAMISDHISEAARPAG